jgi:predicted ATP-binding protein involved in virulence
MVVTKGGVELRLDQLSDGERNLIALAGDLARRMVIADPTNESPLDTVGVILIDEIEQHLHPAWQRQVIPALRRAFPQAQLIVTTHSPQVLSSVPASAVVLLDGSSAHPITGATEGRDTNAILREVFGVPERPQPQLDALRAIRALIDDDALDAAHAHLDALAASLSEQDDDVVALRMRMHVAEAAEGGTSARARSHPR